MSRPLAAGGARKAAGGSVARRGSVAVRPSLTVRAVAAGGPGRPTRRARVNASEADGEVAEGRGLSRRHVLGGLGIAAAGGLVGAGVTTWVEGDPSVVASPAPSSTFVFDPGPGADADAFARWADLVDAVHAAPPGDKWIEVRQNLVVPSGSWDLDGAGFRGDRARGVGLGPHGNPVVVRFAEGARLENAGRLLAQGDIVLCSDSAAPVIAIDDERSYYLADDAWVTSTVSPFFVVRAPAGTLVLLSFRTGSGLVHASTADLGEERVASVDHRGDATLVVAMASGNNIFDDDTVVGTSVVIAAMSPAAGIRQPDLPRTGFRHRGTATVTPLVFSAAVNVAYTPTDAGRWSGPPGNVGEALDELAARLDALEG